MYFLQGLPSKKYKIYYTIRPADPSQISELGTLSEEVIMLGRKLKYGCPTPHILRKGEKAPQEDPVAS